MKKPPIYIQISIKRGVVLSITLLSISSVCLFQAFRSKPIVGIIVLVLLSAFFLYLSGVGIYSLFSKKYQFGKIDFEMLITEDTLTILEKVSGKNHTLAWSDLSTIAIYNRRPDKDEYDQDICEQHWCISTISGTEATCPLRCNGDDVFVEKIMGLPGIDLNNLTSSILSVKKGFTTVWQRKTV